MLGAAGAEDALDAGHQLAGGRDAGVCGESLGDIQEVAGGQRRAGRDAVGSGIVPAEPQQLVGKPPRLPRAAYRATSRLIGTQVRQ